MRPVIGISTTIYHSRIADIVLEDHDYVRAIERAGGLPLLFPLTENMELVSPMLDRVEGLVLCGGMDVSPFYYGQDPHPKTRRLSPLRDRMEMELFLQAKERGLPILGVCRGFQLINVALGGTLIQDIPSQRPHALVHANSEDENDRHFVDIDPDSDFFKSMGQETMVVNSIHHQAIEDLAEGLRVAATARDGIIEAFEGENIWAFQFHPERLEGEMDTRFRKLFRDFVERCRR